MLGILKKIFNKKNLSYPQAEFHSNEDIESSNFLTDPDRINSLLNEIQKTSLLCTLYIEGSKEVFSTSLIKNSLESNQLIFEELSPKSGNDLLMIKKNKVKLTTSINRVQISFLLTNIKRYRTDGITYNKAKKPKRIYYPQRRSAPRVLLDNKNIPFFGTLTTTNTPFAGFVFDISREGIGLEISNPTIPLEKGDSMKNCRITIDNYTIHFDLTICLVNPLHKIPGTIQIGTHIKNVPPKDQNRLEHFITSLERKEIRNRKV